MSRNKDQLQWDLGQLEDDVANEYLMGNTGELYDNMIHRMPLEIRAIALYEELKHWEEEIPFDLERIMEELGIKKEDIGGKKND